MFVCLGNICRSPLAHTVMEKLIEEENLQGKMTVESSGTGDWHIGNKADSRMRACAQGHGLDITHRARHFKASDLSDYDKVYCMDYSNRENVEVFATEDQKEKIHLLREYDPEASNDLEVPDPYYGGNDGFEKVYELVDRSCRALLAELKKEINS